MSKAAATPVPRVLSIAGSDSGGGAGVQADLKAFARCGVHGMTALTAITAQNTVAVTGVWSLPQAAIVEQVRAVADDIGVDAVKIGMLGNSETIAAVAAALDLLPGVPVVLDPVMVAESGATLLDKAARADLRTTLVPRAAVVTPNLMEARILAELETDDAEALGHAILALGPRAVVVTGGHRDRVADLFCAAGRVSEIGGVRFPDGAAHGSGCTHSSALAAGLARGLDPLDAAREAKAIASSAVRQGLREIGRGAGPVDVFGLMTRTGAAGSEDRAGAPAGRRRLT